MQTKGQPLGNQPHKIKIRLGKKKKGTTEQTAGETDCTDYIQESYLKILDSCVATIYYQNVPFSTKNDTITIKKKRKEKKV